MNDDDLSVHEFEAAPFRAGELNAIARYREAIAGIPDSFDVFDLALVHWHVSEFGPEQTYRMLREQGTSLNTWYLALDGLLGDLLTCTAESTTYSEAARRFIRAEADQYHRARQGFEHTVTRWSLGLDASPTGDYPPLTRTVNLAMQSLEA
jgi:uncharacterized protein (DUF2336 family)